MRPNRIHGRLGHLQEQVGRREGALAAQTEKAEAEERTADEVGERLVLAEALRQQAERAHDDTKQASTASVEKQRAALEPDRACPVCGSTDHPYTVGDHGFGEALRVLRRQLKECTQEVEALTRQREERRATALQARARIKEVLIELEAIRVEQAAAHEAWGASPLALDTAAVPDTECGAWISEQLRRSDDHSRRLNTRLDEYHAATRTRDTKRQERDDADDAARLAERAEIDARRAVDLSEAAADTFRKAVLRNELQRDNLLTELEPVMNEADWRVRWNADPGAVHKTYEQQVVQYREHLASDRDAQEQVRRVEGSIYGLLEAARGTEERTRRSQEAFESLQSELTRIRVDRASLLGGRPADDVARELQGSLLAARTKLEQHEQLAGDARSAHVEAGVRLVEATNLLHSRERAADDARAALGSWLTRFNSNRGEGAPLDVATARDLLTHDAEWLATEIEAIGALQRARSDARSVLEERRRHRQSIEAQRTSDATADTLRDQRRRVGQELDRIQSRRIEVESQAAAG